MFGIVVGLAAGAVLVGIGIIRQVTYQATDAVGRNAGELQQELAEISEETAALAENNEQVFEATGFSSSFYQSSQSRTNRELEKADLEYALGDVDEANHAANIFNTSAFYFILAALICWLATVTVFLIARRRPKSASVVE